MNTIDAATIFVKESIPYITIRSIDNFIKNINSKDLSPLIYQNAVYINVMDVNNVYLFISINNNIHHRYILKFDNLNTVKYLINNNELFLTYDEIKSTTNYDEQPINYNNHVYSLTCGLYKLPTCFQLIDLDSREILLYCGYEESSNLIISITRLATTRFPSLSFYNEYDKVSLDELPLPIKEQIIANSIKLSLR